MVLDGNGEVAGWSRELRKGVLDLAILAHLRQGPAHGYSLIQRLKHEGLMATGGAEATVYQALQRLATAGLAASDWSSPKGSERPRKIYQITAAGEIQYGQMTAEWHALRDAIDKLQEDA